VYTVLTFTACGVVDIVDAGDIVKCQFIILGNKQQHLDAHDERWSDGRTECPHSVECHCSDCVTNKKYVLLNSESVQCNLFIFDQVTFVQFKICCRVQNFIKIGWFFTEIWRYIDFQNGGCPSSWNCFTTIRDHPRSLCCWPQLPVKFHVNLIHRSEDIVFEFFTYLGRNAYSGPENGGFGDFGPLNVIIHHRDPQKAHPCINPCLISYQL